MDPRNNDLSFVRNMDLKVKATFPCVFEHFYSRFFFSSFCPKRPEFQEKNNEPRKTKTYLIAGQSSNVRRQLIQGSPCVHSFYEFISKKYTRFLVLFRVIFYVAHFRTKKHDKYQRFFFYFFDFFPFFLVLF